MSSPYPPPQSNPYATAAPPQQPQPAPYGAPPAYGAPAPAYGSPAPAYGAPAPAPAYGAPAPAYGAPAPAYGAPAPAYGAPAYGAQPYGAPAPAYAPPGVLTCRFCGGFPAVQTTVRGHQGMIIIMRFLRQPGPFCRTCGTAMVRHMSARTLVQGWWGYLSSVMTPITLLRNLVAHNKIKRLPPAAPGPLGPQLDPGKPLLRRPAALMLLVPAAGIALFLALVVFGAAVGHSTNSNDNSPFNSTAGLHTPLPLDIVTGDCLHNTGTDDSPALKQLPCSDPSAELKVLGRVNGATDGETACDKYPNYEKSFTHHETGNNYVLCLVTNKPAAGAGT
ncbi:hypothetical protein OG500_24090 [Kitasatospora sp. NBC_01250]|uniref:LppU/SCO3897 family protein n=1 Tax=unclassified Kitasatospora TaxID=2633591 RepID=UPI002E0F66CA|nr:MULTISPECIES: hypothetical protein [unclassified Kitasatospora]WSJ69214.1 hypothetical protein OG294_25640 [Kitasatospora sp. NBC_01302]